MNDSTTSNNEKKPSNPKKYRPNNFKSDFNKKQSLYKLKVYFNSENASIFGKSSLTFFSYKTKNAEMAYGKLCKLKDKWLSKSNICIIYNNATFEQIEKFYPLTKS